MRHLPFLLLVVLYIMVIGRNWGIYTAALLAAVYRRYGSQWNSVPFRL